MLQCKEIEWYHDNFCHPGQTQMLDMIEYDVKGIMILRELKLNFW